MGFGGKLSTISVDNFLPYGKTLYNTCLFFKQLSKVIEKTGKKWRLGASYPQFLWIAFYYLARGLWISFCEWGFALQ
ncbi:hypothetical protein, partial [Conchiformibius steedae]|uniref:hypothetical protein n=1 Tax=Conchiformibius steedae TaxID=153493 RepID=UPI0026EC17DE